MALQDVIERIRQLDTPPNEEATKFQAVLPILQELGWDFFDQSRVMPEYPVGTRKSGKVDLALMAPRRGPVALIEVKAAGVRLNDHVDQMLGYAFNEGVDICVLTTGWEWWLYLPREKGRPEERRFAELSLDDDTVTNWSMISKPTWNTRHWLSTNLNGMRDRCWRQDSTPSAS